jgi:DNA phosphorothioation-dependent restriction protein DptH
MNNYKIFSSKPESCVSIFEWMDRVRVIDLTEINSDSVKRVVVSLILDVLNKEMLLLGASKTDSEGRRELRAMIVVDEAHQFMQRDFNAMEQILRQGRAFGVGMVLSSQNIGDFKTKNNDYTNYVASWILHHVNSVSKQDLVSVFGATDKYIQQYMDYINNAQIFESIAKIGIDNACSMHDYPYFELIKQDERFKPKELSLFD